MAKIHIKGLVAKKTAGGIRYYWEPNAIERRAGWTSMPLGMDAIAAAQKAESRNQAVLGWKAGGAAPRAVKKFLKPRTFGAIIDQYRREHLSQKATSTQRVHSVALRRLETWAGDQPVHYINRQRVKVLVEGLMAPVDKGGIGHSPAYATLKMLREVFNWAIREELAESNPARSFGIQAPPPRDQMWEPEDIIMLDRAAVAAGLPSIGFAVRLAEYLGQREGDLIQLGRAQWRDVTMQCDLDQRALLASDTGPDAGRVMGFVLKQNKSKRTVVIKGETHRVGGRAVSVPVAGDIRAEIEQRFADQDARNREKDIAVTTLLVDDRTGLPWKQDYFIREFAQIRARAIDLAIKEGQGDIAARMSDLQFRDLRRTCVVRLFELGEQDTTIAAITGHKLETTRKILETYAPRTTRMAGRAQVARIHQAARDDDRAATTRAEKEQQA